MKGFLTKDFLHLKNQKKFLIVICFLGIYFVLTQSEPLFGIAYSTFLFSFFAISSISYDEYDNGMCFLMTLPANRKSYVREKYVFGALLALFACSFSVIITIIFQISRHNLEDVLQTLAASGIILLTSILFTAITLVFVLKYGAEKGRLILIIFFGVIAALLYIGNSVLKKNKINIGPTLASSIDHHLVLITIAAVLFCLLVTCVCCKISENIMLRKEF